MNIHQPIRCHYHICADESQPGKDTQQNSNLDLMNSQDYNAPDPVRGQDSQPPESADRKAGVRLSVKAGDQVYYQGRRWSVKDCNETREQVNLARDGFRLLRPEDVAKLNHGRPLQVGERYAIERSNGHVQEGWQLLILRVDGWLLMYKEDAQLVTVGVAEVSAC